MDGDRVGQSMPLRGDIANGGSSRSTGQCLPFQTPLKGPHMKTAVWLQGSEIDVGATRLEGGVVADGRGFAEKIDLPHIGDKENRMGHARIEKIDLVGSNVKPLYMARLAEMDGNLVAQIVGVDDPICDSDAVGLFGKA